MTYQEYVTSKSTKELEDELNALNNAISVFECFGSRDVILREIIESELEKRKADL